jgi:hypothetical protein
MLDDAVEVVDGFAVRQAGEREVGDVERLVGGAPAAGARERGCGVGVATIEVEDAAERPEVECAAAGRARARCEAQVPHRLLNVAESLASASCVLVSHVGQNLQPDELNRNLERAVEPAVLVMGQVELAKEHRSGGAVDRTRRREAERRVLGPRPSGASGDCLLQMLLWASHRSHSFTFPSH